MELDGLLQTIRREGEVFCEKLEGARNLACIEGQFARFLGAEPIRTAQQAAAESKIAKKRNLRYTFS